MNIHEIALQFPDSELKNGDRGHYIELRIAPLLYLICYERNFDPELHRGNICITTIPKIKTTEDIHLFINLFKHE